MPNHCTIRRRLCCRKVAEGLKILLSIKKNALNLELRDCDLSEEGLQQTRELREQVNELDVKIVLVSPMRRTLKTAYEVLCEHPKFEEIKFIVVPEIREVLGAFCGLIGEVSEVIPEFKAKIPQLDTTMIEDQDGNLRDLLREFTSKHSAFKDSDFTELSQEDILGIVRQAIQDNYPSSIETMEEIKQRVSETKPIVKKYIDQLSSDASESNQASPKILLVSHHHYLVEYLGIERSDKGEVIPNCKLLSDPTDYSSIS
ncbi:unnamed protein product [Moneuplotes crassus]|uniref:Uncharacterized protein n=1 Tax=Euplotes crassus TaxID=5936 RepID=A0AAD1XGC5_EUPCR|nr:unnamed protein product [Moneuplotes crassus]